MPLHIVPPRDINTYCRMYYAGLCVSFPVRWTRINSPLLSIIYGGRITDRGIFKLSGGKLAMRIVALVAAVVGIVFLFASNSHTAYAEQAQSSTGVTVSSSADQTI